MNAGLTFDEWWHLEGIHKVPRGNQPPEHAHIAELAWNAALAALRPVSSITPQTVRRIVEHYSKTDGQDNAEMVASFFSSAAPQAAAPPTSKSEWFIATVDALESIMDSAEPPNFRWIPILLRCQLNALFAALPSDGGGAWLSVEQVIQVLSRFFDLSKLYRGERKAAKEITAMLNAVLSSRSHAPATEQSSECDALNVPFAPVSWRQRTLNAEMELAVLTTEMAKLRRDTLEEAAQLCEKARHNEAHHACCTPTAIRALTSSPSSEPAGKETAK